MILVIDNYDSFTYNLVQMVEAQGADVVVRRSDEVTAEEAEAMGPAGLLVSPGPGVPDEARNTPAIVERLAGQVPILGVCLGHQVLARLWGAEVVRAPAPVHGKVERITHDGRGVFVNVPTPVNVVRYHSLAVDEATLPATVEVSARSEGGVVMGIRHRELPMEGVQFHPESILTESGDTMLSNFIRLATHPTAGWRPERLRSAGSAAAGVGARDGAAGADAAGADAAGADAAGAAEEVVS
ncbi:MAG TPA: aminodeoxychorismate/anthranilate synthase component II [Longimicrobiales bacterium]|nr:aminodeoxychorismate/anthranilate synthase component II [Longimicrobiales bacterium]